MSSTHPPVRASRCSVPSPPSRRRSPRSAAGARDRDASRRERLVVRGDDTVVDGRARAASALTLTDGAFRGTVGTGAYTGAIRLDVAEAFPNGEGGVCAPIRGQHRARRGHAGPPRARAVRRLVPGRRGPRDRRLVHRLWRSSPSCTARQVRQARAAAAIEDVLRGRRGPRADDADRPHLALTHPPGAPGRARPSRRARHGAPRRPSWRCPCPPAVALAVVVWFPCPSNATMGMHRTKETACRECS